jgi:hypothetical protein
MMPGLHYTLNEDRAFSFSTIIIAHKSGVSHPRKGSARYRAKMCAIRNNKPDYTASENPHNAVKSKIKNKQFIHLMQKYTYS